MESGLRYDPTRIASDVLRSILCAWYDLEGKTGLPRLGEFGLSRFGVQDRSFIAECIDEDTLRYVRVGSMLTARATRVIEGDTVAATALPGKADTELGAAAAAYGRCRRTRLPNYEYARYDFRAGAPLLFERLLLPFSVDRADVTHLIGVVFMSDPQEDSLISDETD